MHTITHTYNLCAEKRTQNTPPHPYTGLDYKMFFFFDYTVLFYGGDFMCLCLHVFVAILHLFEGVLCVSWVFLVVLRC